MAKVKEVEQKIEEKVKVVLAEIKEGVHTIFTKTGKADFVDGTAEVTEQVATELKDTGLVK